MDYISVIIPLYNKVSHISRTINSVMKQTKLPEEIIVIDDGSTDGSGDLVNQMQNPLIRLIRQDNKGVGAARNHGISLARGDLIALLDADDWWKPEYLEVISDMRKIYPDAGAYATAFDIKKPEGRKLKKNIKGISLSSSEKYHFIDNLFAGGVDPPLLLTSAVVIPKNVFKEVGYFDEERCLGEDIDMWVRIGIKYPIVWNSSILATYNHQLTNNYSKTRNISKEPSFSVNISDSIKSGMVPKDKIKDLREYGAYYQYWAVRQLIMNNQKEIAVNIINKTKGTKYFYRQGWILLVFALLPTFFMEIAINFYRRIFLKNK